MSLHNRVSILYEIGTKSRVQFPKFYVAKNILYCEHVLTYLLGKKNKISERVDVGRYDSEKKRTSF